MSAFDFEARTRAVYGAGTVARLGELTRGLGFRRTLLVADPGLVAAGHVERAVRILTAAGVEIVPFHAVRADPDTALVESGAAFASAERIDSLLGLGGGSSMDCAKGINFILTNGGCMADYRGYGKAKRPLLPMIAVPTTAGTGSEAQSYALIAYNCTHGPERPQGPSDDAEFRLDAPARPARQAALKSKMACGDPGAAFRVAVLDPELTLTQPAAVTAGAGYDALSHAVETYVTTRRNELSDLLAREAFRLLDANYERVLQEPDHLEARGAMLLGAHLAGAAIELSMLGATHACANPLTARHGTAHGAAISLLLAHVVRWNAAVADERYADLLRGAGRAVSGGGGDALAARLEALATAGGLPRTLRAAGVREAELPDLAADAAEQWTGRFNPRPFDAAAALAIYTCAL